MAAARKRRMLLSVTIAALTAIPVTRVAAQSPVSFRSGPTRIATPTNEHLASLAATARGRATHFVVQFAEVPDKGERDTLESDGLHLLGYIGAGAFFATLDPAAADATRIAALPGLVGIDFVRSEWKTHEALLSGRPPEWSIVAGDRPGDRTIAAYVIFHADVPPRDGESLLAALGASIRSRLVSLNGLVVEMPEAALSSLAAADIVQWIEPPLPPLSEVNNVVRTRTGAEIAQAPPYGLTGAGITVLVYDGGGARASHLDFQGRLTVPDATPTNVHATHVAGTIGGAGVANPLYRGMAPGVTLLSYGLQGVGSSSPLYNDPGDLETDYSDAINFGGAVISNNSLGSNVEGNGFDCNWQGDYGVTSALIDAIVRGSLGSPMRVIWANGNERYGTRCNIEGHGSFYSIAPPSGAKNHLTVGAVNSNDDSMTAFSSWGPTDDGRIKPDVCAPGCETGGDSGVTSCSGYSDTEYLNLCGTSMAAPTVCGLAALVLEDFKAQFPNQPLPRNATLRALFAHTAVDLGNTGPDYKFGYGSVRVNAAVDQLRAARFAESTIDHEGLNSRTLVVEPGSPELRVTLAWDDAPAAPNATVTLINDLDLIVLGPDGTRYFPWTLNPADPDAPAVRTQADHINNIEQVLVSNPDPGLWTISVAGASVPSGPQPYGLVGDGATNIATVFLFPGGLPDVVPPAETADFDVQVLTFGQSLVPDSGVLMYRTGSEPFASLPMLDLGGGLFRATLPAAPCGAAPSYYVVVSTSSQGAVTEPPNAPSSTLGHSVGAWSTFFSDDFELAGGWTVFAGAYSGNWERADPQQVLNLGAVTQPADDHTTGSGALCYVTGPLAGLSASAFDVDGGPSRLTSPVFDLAGRDAIVSCWRWYYMSVTLDDLLEVAVTPDGLNWTVVEEVRRSESAWVFKEWHVSDYITPTATVQIRFTVNDTDPGSLIEALIDDFEIRYVACEPPHPGDMNCDHVVDFFDIDPFVLALGGPGDYNAAYPGCHWIHGDCDGDSDVDFFDIDPFVELIGTQYP